MDIDSGFRLERLDGPLGLYTWHAGVCEPVVTEDATK